MLRELTILLAIVVCGYGVYRPIKELITDKSAVWWEKLIYALISPFFGFMMFIILYTPH
jgi:hypothetical protein